VKRLVLAMVALAACKTSSEPDKLPVPEPTPIVTIDAAVREPVDEEAAEAERLMQEMTAGAVDGAQLMRFAPETLAGLTRTNRLEQVFAVAAAYELGNGTYANLDIKNSFRRGGIDLEDQLMRACKRPEKVAGYTACVIVKPDRASFHWDLPDRLTVDLSAPSEKLARKMAAELPLAEVATLSKAASEP
jgi:hypothetical protein